MLWNLAGVSYKDGREKTDSAWKWEPCTAAVALFNQEKMMLSISKGNVGISEIELKIFTNLVFLLTVT